jgi:pimeloyl-ACP methyl ester carboxylesterase
MSPVRMRWKLVAATLVAAAALIFSAVLVKRQRWHGYRRSDFVVDGRNCILVAPKQVAHGSPWIWRPEFFGGLPEVDLALLEKGFHVAYIDVQNMFGAPVALDHMDRFYEHLTSSRQLARKVVLHGISRGGLFALNWAARNPERVACIYLDAPVCDFKSWPGTSGPDWEQCKRAYGFSEEQALAYPFNPVDNLKSLARAKIPIIAVAGDRDEVVPMKDNIGLVERRYRELGGEVKVIVKPGGGHHPHGPPDPAVIVDFILAHPQ